MLLALTITVVSEVADADEDADAEVEAAELTEYDEAAADDPPLSEISPV